MTVFIDRSHFNGTDDYSAAPVTHLYARATESTSAIDATYQSRTTAARAAGAKVGAYHFGGVDTPIAEADYFISHTTIQPGDLRPCLDAESGQTTAWVEAFARRFEAILGYLPVIYGATNTVQAWRIASARVAACPWWRAEFGADDGVEHALAGGDLGCCAHQYTSIAVVPGVAIMADRSAILNESRLSIPELTFLPSAALGAGNG